MKDKKPKKIRGKKPKAQTTGKAAPKTVAQTKRGAALSRINEIFKRAAAMRKASAAGEDEDLETFRREMWFHDQLSGLSDAWEEGWQKGMAEAVLKLLEQGPVAPSAVKKATGFSIEELRKEASKTSKID